MTPSRHSYQPVPNAFEIIIDDLEADRRARQRYYRPAWILLTLSVIGYFLASGIRPDLLSLPPLQLVSQVLTWALALLVFPAVGVGLRFPSRPTQLSLLGLGVVTTLLGTVGVPSPTDFEPLSASATWTPQVDLCFLAILGFGTAIAAIAWLTGALSQRRRVRASLWIAASTSLLSLNIVNWHCARGDVLHTWGSHIIGASVLILATAILTYFNHRIRNKKSGAPPMTSGA